mmetsp:Transcript_50399/g.109446  ORF Transcript_50399/g.109446 Transcript_50399/m.109446 type:complete len:308 (-) Transcript_50399:284-1207(-)|eukprot:CAMPEP_0170590830 /NCGR_PEP_ID=MMETSP0224-20130122/12078_1 /TAXON_ID=285029 /ORGANISM="Togula jolla, Strain CCCM 725" /LENGTH=307 /DNA_ID=CAMNT_0010914651 /DNA_START=59 /DNA_END=982 /DNA_ORIENTATION=-
MRIVSPARKVSAIKHPRKKSASTPTALLLKKSRSLSKQKTTVGKKRSRDVKEQRGLKLSELRTIVINLKRRPDRMAECAAILKARCVALTATRFEATDGRVDVIPTSEVGTSWNTARNTVYQRIRSIRKGWNDLDTYAERTLEMSGGERGCAYSHVRAWRHCVEHGRPILVLEDDAQPTPDFTPVLKRALQSVPEDTHVLYLGYSKAADWRSEISPELVESEYVWTTVAYIVWPAGARLLLSRLPVDQPVDNFMACLSADRQLKALCVRPKIVRQREAWNVNSDVSHSDEKSTETALTCAKTEVAAA